MVKIDNCVKIIKVNWNIKVSKENNLEKIAQTAQQMKPFMTIMCMFILKINK